jgi:hypothetical protein
LRRLTLENINRRHLCERLVDLVGIEPTTSSMPWKNHSSRRLILKQLTTGELVKNGYIGRYFRPISGKISM